MSGRFRPELLPDPKGFFEIEFGQFKTRPNRAGWVAVPPRCHKSRSGRSVSVNIKHGAGCCHAGCGEWGDIVGYVMWRDRCSFEAACRKLGCWSDDGRPALPRRKEPPKTAARLLAEAVFDGPPLNPSRDERVRSRNELHDSRRRFQEISEHLAADRENESLWGLLQVAHEDLDLSDAAYRQSCGEKP